MTISDVLPTLLEAIGAGDRIPGDLDGASRWATLTGRGSSRTPDYVTSVRGAMALYRSPWKLVIEGGGVRLYDVFEDPLEERDLAGAHPERVAELSAVARAWPRHDRPGETTILQLLVDPDRFGGPEDRPPWADVARSRARDRD